MAGETKIIETPEQKETRLNWMQTPYKRAPWIKASVHLAERIPHFWKQDNPEIAKDDVMKPREQPIGHGSDAFPQQPIDHTPAGMHEGSGPEGAI